MPEMQLVNTVIPFVPFVVLGNYLLLMRTAQRIQIQFGEDFKILKVRFILTRKKAPNIAELSPKENSDRNLFFPHSIFSFKIKNHFKKKN